MNIDGIREKVVRNITGGVDEKIKIKRESSSDTRTCDYTKVTKEELYKNSLSHISDVNLGISYLIRKLREAALLHDVTKTYDIDKFYNDFKTGFENTDWWEEHQKVERHHFNDGKYIQDDINLIDVLEQIVDGVMAGMARTGKYRHEPISNELLQRAYNNTAKLLIDNTSVV